MEVGAQAKEWEHGYPQSGVDARADRWESDAQHDARLGDERLVRVPLLEPDCCYALRNRLVGVPLASGGGQGKVSAELGEVLAGCGAGHIEVDCA